LKTVDMALEIQGLLNIMEGDKKTQHTLLSDLGPNHFGVRKLRDVFKRLQKLTAAGKTIPTRNEMVLDPALTKEAKTLLREAEVELVKNPSTLVDHLTVYYEIRGLFETTKRSLEILETETHSLESLSKLRGEIADDLSRIGTQEKLKVFHAGVEDTLEETVENILRGDKDQKFLKTGLDEYDERTGGVRRGELVIISANTGGGKSMLAGQLSVNMYKDFGHSVVAVPLEMDEEEWMERVLSCSSGVDYGKIGRNDLDDDEERLVRKAYKRFNNAGRNNTARYSIFPASFVTPHEIATYLKPYCYDVWIIDYLSLVTPTNRTGIERVDLGEIAKEFKLYAKQLDVTVFLLAQLNEDDDVKYAKAVKEHSDRVWWWRIDPEDLEVYHRIKVNQSKARRSPLYPFWLTEDFATASLTSMPAPVAGHEDEGEDKPDEKKKGKKKKRNNNKGYMKGL